jgi:hypothetical protein
MIFKHPHEASALRVPLLVIPAQAGGAFQQTQVWSSSSRAA